MMQQRWEPLGEGERVTPSVWVEGRDLWISCDALGWEVANTLPEGYALCRLVPCEPPAGVPLPAEVVEAIREMSLTWRNIYGPVKRYKIVEAWLNQQAQKGWQLIRTPQEATHNE